TNPNQHPNKDWLNLVKTARARTKIRYLLRKEQRERAISLGKDILDKGLRKRGLTLSKSEKQLDNAARELRLGDSDELVLQVGYISRGKGVTVHRRDCDKGLDLDPERRVEVSWDGHGKGTHEVAIQVLCADKPGLLATISQSFSEAGVNISQAHCRATDSGRA